MNGTTLVPTAYSIPCGYFPSMYIGNRVNLLLSNGTLLNLNQQGRTVFTYAIQDYDAKLQWTSFKDPFFQNWMENNAALSTHKFVGTVPGGFEGQVTLIIQCKLSFMQCRIVFLRISGLLE